ncbi:Gfo/Idh/MocA family protein [Brucella cytisi]|uniref:1-carboxy-3-chloro-3,4-dihydroxycyclo hexa-1,5-diene dehydrogenase n=1 Tax=Brucella cytisi TaxID=407152 RepID=A0A1J6HF94_9HYPH|nr:Gfo/Idh/MocA family oxidoreductase [Brucella cytisi]NKC52349.1 Gfo/Idh/MocA family oxidoreductase [Brucella cytisi]OIS91628.1 1-carboxy-3-chloro-3,4-dihydroxycyclo hexa-1,5-diene dehydrogenase [Brucella cytisi]
MLGIGIIGAGHFGAAHAKALQSVPGARLVAACRNDAEGLAAFTTDFGGSGYQDYRELLADPKVDAVVIALPHHLHANVAIACAEAGKHIMIEKPMAPTVAECRSILAAAQKAGVTLMPGHTMRFSLPFVTAKRIIDTGKLGNMRYGSSRMIKLWMEGNRRDWHRDPATGGGMLFTAGIHALDRLLAFAGRRATHVSAITATSFHKQKADDAALLLIRFADEAAGQVSSIGYSDGAFISGDELVFDNGVMTVDFFKGVTLGRSLKWQPVEGSIEPEVPERGLVRQWHAFVHAVNTGSLPPVTGEDGLHVVACIEAAFKASRERREVAIEG